MRGGGTWKCSVSARNPSTVTLPLTAPVEPFPQNLHRFLKELLQARIVAAHSLVVVVS
jgi:hypothetical protein